MTKSGWVCSECLYEFLTTAAAKKAALGVRGCPKCGGHDVDLGEVLEHCYPTKAGERK